MWLSIFSAILLAIMTQFLTPINCYGKDYTIYSITQNVPMGYENEVIKKNYYIDFGSQQGAQEGAVMEVFRIYSEYNPYDNNKQHRFRVKVAEIKISHIEDYSSIAELIFLSDPKSNPDLEISYVMIGDRASLKLN